ncbi:huntingtin-interacting protein K-like [Eucalyptus grandis]|uniref:huntingtin-interacting protein K-like n=1 Tax=Eucalyptus grandis TaxID=71139 RepID=UPI00192EA961|nr:huntingtin-interacting protein K-like [Eucalyptus grandis]
MEIPMAPQSYSLVDTTLPHLSCGGCKIFCVLREKELAAVKINAADVDIIANEPELDRKVAERTLCEHKGDTVAAIRSLLQ